MSPCPPIPASVAPAFDAMSPEHRRILETLRSLIHDVADATPGVGAVTESLKWGQPSYAVSTGTPLRLGLTKDESAALFVHCQTRVIADARAVFSQDLCFEGNRAVLIPTDNPVPVEPLRQVICSALTYRMAR
ncbi:DUF1801 domain-containing protein [Marivita sp. S2033]|uniref:DUF1801 domain-containing protein n=1 Tax=Marivita sp. S2033 TaxID=3373187 RepID=UPI003981DC39